eukprot:548928_1
MSLCVINFILFCYTMPVTRSNTIKLPNQHRRFIDNSACSTPPYATECTANNPDNCPCTAFTISEKKQMLDSHNNRRDLAASGGEVCADSTGTSTEKCPSATNMNSLIWDNGLEKVSTYWAHQCIPIKQGSDSHHADVKPGEQKKMYKTQCDNDNCNAFGYTTGNIGENIANSASSEPTGFNMDNILGGITLWYDESKKYHFPTKTEFGVVGHWRQGVWASTRYLGCGYAICDNGSPKTPYWVNFVCKYYPAGNINTKTQDPYTSGKKCSDCDNDRNGCIGSGMGLCGGGQCPACGSSIVTKKCDYDSNSKSCPTDRLCDDGLDTLCIYNGHPSLTYGDPHFRTFGGDYHDFQGVGDTNSEQYYYLTRTRGSTTSDVPFNILLKHKPIFNGGVRALDYITFELFDSNNDYYLIFLRYFAPKILKYTANPVPPDTSTLYDANDNNFLSTFTVGTKVNIGELFVAELISLDYVDYYLNYRREGLYFTLTVDNSCSISLWMTHYALIVDPPTCYKFHIAGLLGDFVQPAIAGRNAKLQTCDANYIDTAEGWTDWSPGFDTAYSENGLSWTLGVCERINIPTDTPTNTPTSNPTLNTPHPTINTPQPTINTSNPTINTPQPTIAPVPAPPDTTVMTTPPDTTVSTAAPATTVATAAPVVRSQFSIATDRRRRLEELVGAPDDFIFVDLCPPDTEIAIETMKQCEKIRNKYSAVVCDKIPSICDKLQEHCNYDCCAMANNDISAVASVCDDTLGSTLGLLSDPAILAKFDPALLEFGSFFINDRDNDESDSDNESDSGNDSGDSSSMDFGAMNDNGNIDGDIIDMNFTIVFDMNFIIVFVILLILVNVCFLWCFYEKDEKKIELKTSDSQIDQYL